LTDSDGQRALRAAAQAAQAAYHKAALRQHLLALGAQKKARDVPLNCTLILKPEVIELAQKWAIRQLRFSAHADVGDHASQHFAAQNVVCNLDCAETAPHEYAGCSSGCGGALSAGVHAGDGAFCLPPSAGSRRCREG
jgi:hypothetical protein